MRTHPATAVAHGPWSAEVDLELAPLVVEIWRAGIPTVHSCQDVGENIADLVARLPHLEDVAHGERGRAGIGFADVEGLLRFHDLLSNAGPRDGFYERLLHWASPGAWQCTVGRRDLGLEEDEAPRARDGTPRSRVVAASFQVRFPRADIAEATARVQRANRSEEVALGRPTWAAITVAGEEPRRGARRP